MTRKGGEGEQLGIVNRVTFSASLFSCLSSTSLYALHNNYRTTSDNAAIKMDINFLCFQKSVSRG